MKYTVTCQHWGDKQYYEGDEREVKVKGDAEQLIKAGLIADPDAAEEAKAEKEKADADAAEQAKIDAEAQAEADAKADAEKEAPKPKNKMAKEVANKSE